MPQPECGDNAATMQDTKARKQRPNTRAHRHPQRRNQIRPVNCRVQTEQFVLVNNSVNCSLLFCSALFSNWSRNIFWIPLHQITDTQLFTSLGSMSINCQSTIHFQFTVLSWNTQPIPSSASHCRYINQQYNRYLHFPYIRYIEIFGLQAY